MSEEPTPYRFSLRVYYEDTDLAGIVYYANYLRFIERARSEYLRARGIDQSALKRDQGAVFVVTELHAKYHRPARFDDWLDVDTRIIRQSRARMVMTQDVNRADERLFTATVHLACLDNQGRPRAWPEGV